MACICVTLEFQIGDRTPIVDRFKEVKEKHPEIRKIIKLLEKKAFIEDIKFAGDGGFTEDGRFHEKEEVGMFRGLITFYYYEIFDLSTFDGYQARPKKQFYCFERINSVLTPTIK